MRLLIDRFVGMRPALEPHLLQPNEAQIAINTRLETGAIEGAPGFTDLKALTKPLAKTIWRLPATAETDYWLEFLERADVARSPVNEDVWDRIYWTDDLGAHYGPASIVLSGPSFPGASYALGVPAPTNQPIISAFTPGSGSSAEGRVYRETFVTQYNEEGPPGPPSATATVNPANPVTVSGLTPVPSGGSVGNYNITKRRLYRSSFTGNNQGDWQLVAEIPIANLSVVDNVAQRDLGITLGSEGYLPPPAGVKGLRITEGGVAIVGKGRTIYMSEPALPHAFNPDYQQTLQFDFVAVAAFGQCVVVLTTGDLYVAAGLTPDSMQLTRIEQSFPCLSATGVVEGHGGALYPSTVGLVAIGNDFVPRIITAGLMTQDDWLAYNPSSFKASLQDGKYHAAFKRTNGTTGILVLDPTGRSAPCTELSQIPGQDIQAVFHDKTSDTLYVARNSKIQRLQKGGSPQTYQWRSKSFEFNQQPVEFTAFYVTGNNGTLTFRVFADGVLKHTKTISTNRVYRIPTIGRKRSWSFEVQGAPKVTEIRVATSVEELFE